MVLARGLELDEGWGGEVGQIGSYAVYVSSLGPWRSYLGHSTGVAAQCANMVQVARPLRQMSHYCVDSMGPRNSWSTPCVS